MTVLALGFVLLLGLGLVVLVAVFGYLSAKRRREAFTGLAAARGWTYVERDDRWAERFQGSPFDSGFDRRATNILTGQYDGRPCVAFDYRYSTHSTSTDANGNTHTTTDHHPYSVVALDLGVPLPRLEVTPEGFFSRMVGRLTNRDIELESEDFNRAFTVTCPDRKFAFDVLHARTMEYLLTQRDLGWRLQDGSILAIRPGTHDLPEIDARLTAIDHIVDGIPDFVWRQYANTPEHGA